MLSRKVFRRGGGGGAEGKEGREGTGEREQERGKQEGAREANKRNESRPTRKGGTWISCVIPEIQDAYAS